MLEKIPFNRPAFIKKAEAYLSQALQSGHLSGDGDFTKQSTALLEELIGVRKALLTTSCTHALEMAAILMDLKTGDEVILPSFTFVSTVNAVVLRGAKPVFIDIRPDTLNLDENQLERLITPRTKAIFVVHYAGVACEMDTISQISANTTSLWWKITRMGSLEVTKGRILVPLGFWQLKAFTRQRISALVKAARF